MMKSSSGSANVASKSPGNSIHPPIRPIAIAATIPAGTAIRSQRGHRTRCSIGGPFDERAADPVEQDRDRDDREPGDHPATGRTQPQCLGSPPGRDHRLRPSAAITTMPSAMLMV